MPGKPAPPVIKYVFDRRPGSFLQHLQGSVKRLVAGRHPLHRFLYQPRSAILVHFSGSRCPPAEAVGVLLVVLDPVGQQDSQFGQVIGPGFPLVCVPGVVLMVPITYSSPQSNPRSR